MKLLYVYALIIGCLTVDDGKAQTIGTTPTDSTGRRIIYDIVAEMPTPIGGEREIFNAVSKVTLDEATANNYKYIFSKLFVEFIVEPDGTISNFKVIRGAASSQFLAGVETAISNLSWQPGRHNSQAVPVRCRLPLTICFH